MSELVFGDEDRMWTVMHALAAEHPTTVPDRYDELMGRLKLIRTRWMEMVAEARAEGKTYHEFWSPGTVITFKGDLWMHAKDARGRTICELRIAEGETAVTVVED